MKRRPTKQTPADAFEMVRTVGLALPDVEATTKYDGSPVLKVGGIFMAGLATHPSAEPETLVVRAGFEEREWLLEDAPETYYLTDYYRRYPVVLVRLSRIDRDALRDVLSVSWRLTLAKARKRGRPRRGRSGDVLPFFQYVRPRVLYPYDMSLDGKVAVVTGATRGVGRGIARELARQGARSLSPAARQPDLRALDERSRPSAATIESTSRWKPHSTGSSARPARIDILVNNVWGGYERMVEDGEFTWTKPFWEQPLWRWDAMFSAGVRAHYHASQLAAPSMIARAAGTDREHLVLGGAETYRQCRVRRVESRDGQDDGRHGHRAEAAWRRRRFALPGTGQDGKSHGSRARGST